MEEAKRVFDPAAKKALDFNLKRADKYDREQNERVKEPQQPQKSTNRKKKKPWPLPSGTTPYMKKDRITFKQSGEKEKCQIHQIPVGWKNPMLNVANDAVMPSTNKTMR